MTVQRISHRVYRDPDAGVAVQSAAPVVKTQAREWMGMEME